MADKESPRDIRPRHCSLSPQGAKYIAVTQDTNSTSPSGIAEVCDEYLFGRAETGSLGQVTDKKNEEHKRKK